MSFTPLDPFGLITPLGTAVCTGVWIASDPEWICWINSTGEPWWLGNPLIRRRLSVTNGLVGLSPFVRINKPLQIQIERYKASGLLPSDYDPTKPETWPL